MHRTVAQDLREQHVRSQRWMTALKVPITCIFFLSTGASRQEIEADTARQLLLQESEIRRGDWILSVPSSSGPAIFGCGLRSLALFQGPCYKKVVLNPGAHGLSRTKVVTLDQVLALLAFVGIHEAIHVDPQAHRPIGMRRRYAIAIALEVDQAGCRDALGVLHTSVDFHAEATTGGLDLLGNQHRGVCDAQMGVAV